MEIKTCGVYGVPLLGENTMLSIHNGTRTTVAQRVLPMFLRASPTYHIVEVLRVSHCLGRPGVTLNWVAARELKLSYYIGETRLFTIYTHHGNLI